VLQQEVNNLAGLRHPNIVQLLGFSVVKAKEEENNKGKGKGEDQGKNKGRKSMILMELMDEDLHHLIEDQCRSTPEVPPFRQGVAIDIISQIAAGMAYLHHKGIFHGDLKASNVVVNDHGVHIDAKITDFGVSQKIQLDHRGDATSSYGLSDDANSGESSPTIQRSLSDTNSHSDANRGESSLTIRRSLSDPNLYSTDAKAIMPLNLRATSLHHYGSSDATSSMYSINSLSKVVGTTGWMAPEVFGMQVSTKTKHTVGLFLEVDLGDELSLRFENKVSS
jgi:serine/threonine protein kinase